MPDGNGNHPTHPAAVPPPPVPSNKKGLRSRLMVFIALSVLLPTLVTGLLTRATFRRALVDLSLREQTETARRIAERVGASVEGVRRVLLTMASQDFEPPAPPPAPAAPGKPKKPRAAPKRNRVAEDALRRFLKNHPSAMEASLLGMDGRERVKLVRRRKDIIVSIDLTSRSDRDEVRRALAGKVAVGAVFFTMRDRYPQFFLATPLDRGKGVLLARLSLDSLRGLVAEASETGGAEASVVDRQGLLIAHRNPKRVLAHENMLAEPVVREFSDQGGRFVDGPRLSHDRNGKPLLASAHKVTGMPWLVVVQSPLGSALAPLQSAGRRAAVGVAGAGLVFLLGGLWLAYRILKPLRLLQEGVHKIGQGELSHRLDIKTRDEIQKLADEFNGMADSLEKLEGTKRDLTHMIVHDLKSPLSSILGSLDYVLMASKEVTPDHKKLLSLGSKAGKDLLRMIQNLLDLGKMEEGKLELRCETFPLLDLAAQCVDDLEANMHREGKMVSVDIPKTVPKVWADRDLLHRVLSNLLTNALKHTSKGAEIAIRAEGADGGRAIVLSVRDTGEGIPPEYLGKIFEKFGQADMRKQSFRVGTGLGLTFCKLAVESHGGKIWVESEQGRGSEFFVKLPLPGPEGAPQTPVFPSSKISRPVR